MRRREKSPITEDEIFGLIKDKQKLEQPNAKDYLDQYARLLLLKAVNRFILNRKAFIEFTDKLTLGNPGIESGIRSDRDNGRSAYHKIVDPSEFFCQLEKNPNSFKFDCINILPVLQIYTLHKLLVLSGYSLQSVLRIFENTVLMGSYSFIVTRQPGEGHEFHAPMLADTNKAINGHGHVLKPYSFKKAHKQIDSHGNFDSLILRGSEDDIKPNEGDIFHFMHKGVWGLPNYGNSDDWNGIIISPNNDDFKHKCAVMDFKIKDREKSLFRIATQLTKRLPIHGITQENRDAYERYQDMGGLTLWYLGTRYAELFLALARNL